MFHKKQNRIESSSAILLAARMGDMSTINKFINNLDVTKLDQADRSLLVSAYLTAEENNKQEVMQKILSVTGISNDIRHQQNIIKYQQSVIKILAERQRTSASVRCGCSKL
jgi:hypothetical protein